MRKDPFMIVPHRLRIFLIGIVWLSTALISAPITIRGAHALKFDPPAIGYPKSKVIYHAEKRNDTITRNYKKDRSEFIEISSIISNQTNHFWIENQLTNHFLYHFIPYNSAIPQYANHPTSTEFWLNVPSTTKVIGNYDTNDVEVSGLIPSNFSEIDLKGNLFPDYIYKSRTDLFDPSQIVIQKFISNSLIIAFILIFLLFSTCSGLVVLDKFVFRTVLQNCFRSDKNISWNRTKKEIKRLFQFVFKILIIIILYIILNAGFLFLCHRYIVPIPTVIKIFSAFDVDSVVWEKNIEIGLYGDVGEEYERWSKEQNFNPQTARFWQEFLWNYWYILIALILYFGASFYLSVFKISMGFFKHFKKGVIRRKYFYYSVDRSRWVKKNLSKHKNAS